jgi:Tol biopolymer transport system component
MLPHVSSDADHLRRFADEARAAGALNHPNVLTVHDVGEHRGMPFLVTECLEGESLRQRLLAQPMRPHEAVAVALGIARGLAAAHARGIVHRDLKPENVFLRSDGGVKILDFGLAKLQSALEGLHDGSSDSVRGPVFGTAGYMAPEQMNGGSIDGRTDLFALGAVLYEMLAGRRPFEGSHAFERMNAVLTLDPPDLAMVNEDVPEPLARVVTRLLRKSPADRFQSALDLVWALEQVSEGSPARSAAARRAAEATSARRSRSVAPLLAALSLALGVVALGWWAQSRIELPTRVPALTQFTLTLPAGVALDSAPAVSPDSGHIAFVGRDAAASRIYVRALGSSDAVALAGTEGAMQPFWSPDGRSIGFFARQRLMKVAWPGGAPVAIADAPMAHGGAWSPSGAIVFAPDVILTGLRRVRAEGSRVEAASLLDLSRGDTSHWWPTFLPDGVHFLYFVRSTDDERRGVYLGRLDRPASGAGSPLFRSESEVVHAPLPGAGGDVLFYVVDGRVEVRRFDRKRLTVASDARTLGLAAGESTLYHPLMLGASSDVLAFAESGVPWGNRLEVADRTGRVVRLWPEPETQNWPRVSPDGTRLVRQRVDPRSNNPDLWVEDLDRGTTVRVTTAPDPDLQPVWSPDGRSLAYVSGALPGRPGERTLSIAAADGTGVLRRFACPTPYCEPTDWSRSGDALLVNANDGRGWDVWILSSLDGVGRPVLDEPFAERDARFSPDGRWIAYVSDESGKPEVSVRAHAGPPARFVVSGGGGTQPVWRRDGGELFFVAPGGHLHSVTMQWSSEGVPTFASSRQLDVPPIGSGHWGTQYDVSPDGSRIYVLRRNEDPPPHEIRVILGWPRLLG